MIKEIYKRNGQVKINDIGGTRTYWEIVGQDFLSDYKVKILILNLPGTENPAGCSIYEFANGDGCNLKEYGDSSFDIVHSNSVIEHVGNWERMVQFASEPEDRGKTITSKLLISRP